MEPEQASSYLPSLLGRVEGTWRIVVDVVQLQTLYAIGREGQVHDWLQIPSLGLGPHLFENGPKD